MRFTKMQGAGNDYVYINAFAEKIPNNLTALSKRISDRHFGIGSDGLILICPSEIADARMRMFNADGSESEMCGNGLRCVAKYVYDHGIARKKELTLETGRGLMKVQVTVRNNLVEQATIDMGEPILEPEKIPTTLKWDHSHQATISAEGKEFIITCVSMGNPHGIIFVDKITDEHIHRFGRALETHPVFPRRANIEFVEVINRQEANMRVWERGSGETLACGTGACAVAVAGILTNRFDHKVLIHLTGGDLQIEWAKDKGLESGHVFLTGPAVEVFSGDWPEESH